MGLGSPKRSQDHLRSQEHFSRSQEWEGLPRSQNANLSRASEFGCKFGWPRARGGCLSGLAATHITACIYVPVNYGIRCSGLVPTTPPAVAGMLSESVQSPSLPLC